MYCQKFALSLDEFLKIFKKLQFSDKIVQYEVSFGKIIIKNTSTLKVVKKLHSHFLSRSSRTRFFALNASTVTTTIKTTNY